MLFENTKDKTVTLYSPSGATCISLAPGEKREANACFVESAIRAGLRVATMDSDVASAKVAAPVEAVAQADIVSAIVVIMQTGDAAKLDSSGRPRVKEVEAILGANISAADRDAAFKVYELEKAGD